VKTEGLCSNNYTGIFGIFFLRNYLTNIDALDRFERVVIESCGAAEENRVRLPECTCPLPRSDPIFPSLEAVDYSNLLYSVQRANVRIRHTSTAFFLAHRRSVTASLSKAESARLAAIFTRQATRTPGFTLRRIARECQHNAPLPALRTAGRPLA
jgi:hypothetical protein